MAEFTFMTRLLFGLFVLALAAGWTATSIRFRYRALRTMEHQHRFHGLRDELQELALRGVLSVDSATYSFAMWIINVAIRNAGEMKLRDALWLAERVDSHVRRAGKDVWDDFRRQPEEVHRLVGRTFVELGRLMAANDPLVAFGLRVHSWRSHSTRKRILDQIDRLASRILPKRTEVLGRAHDLTRFGSQLASLKPHDETQLEVFGVGAT